MTSRTVRGTSSRERTKPEFNHVTELQARSELSLLHHRNA